MLQRKLSQELIHQMIKEAVKIEKCFVCEAIPVELIGMNSTLMSQYIEFVADRLVVALGYPKIFNTPNPFVSIILITFLSNFFMKFCF